MKKATIGSRVALKGITPFDLLLIIFLIVLSAGFIVRSGFSSTRQDSSKKTAVVHCNGEEIRRIDLGEEMEVDLLDGRMQVIAKDGKIRISHSDCPENTCVHAGWIHLSGEALVCVPNKVAIEIIADTDPVVDAVVF